MQMHYVVSYLALNHHGRKQLVSDGSSAASNFTNTSIKATTTAPQSVEEGYPWVMLASHVGINFSVPQIFLCILGNDCSHGGLHCAVYAVRVAMDCGRKQWCKSSGQLSEWLLGYFQQVRTNMICLHPRTGRARVAVLQGDTTQDEVLRIVQEKCHGPRPPLYLVRTCMANA